MELKKIIKKYQGKCYKHEDDRRIMYVRVVKIKSKEDPIYPYSTIYEFIIYSIKHGDWSEYTENIEERDICPLEAYGWKRTTKSDYKTAKNKCLISQPKYIEKNEQSRK